MSQQRCQRKENRRQNECRDMLVALMKQQTSFQKIHFPFQYAWGETDGS